MNDRQDRFARVYRMTLGFLVQTAAAGLGLYIMYKAITSSQDRPWLYTAAIAMMGLPIAQNFEALVQFLARILNDLSSRSRDELNTAEQARRNDDP